MSELSTSNAMSNQSDVVADDHKSFLRASFAPEYPLDDFANDEVCTLEKHGAWLNALMRGYIKPTTTAQRLFVEMCYGTRKPRTYYEKLWQKYRIEVLYYRAKKEEKNLDKSHSPSYKKVRILYEKLAKLGHRKSVTWMVTEGPWIDMPSEKQSRYTKKLIYNHPFPLYKAVSGSFGMKSNPRSG